MGKWVEESVPRVARRVVDGKTVALQVLPLFLIMSVLIF